METIRLGDKEFVRFINAKQIGEAVDRVAKAINRLYDGKNPLFICVLKGAVFFAADLVRRVSFPAELAFIRVASYCNTTSTGEIKVLQPLVEPVAQRNVVVIDDVLDTGYTYQALRGSLLAQGAQTVRLACLLYKPAAVKCTDVYPDFSGIEIGNDFVVGYGLDYNEMGRTLKDIYVLKSD